MFPFIDSHTLTKMYLKCSWVGHHSGGRVTAAEGRLQDSEGTGRMKTAAATMENQDAGPLKG